MTDPLEITLPDTDCLEEGDLTVNIMTNAVHVLRDGRWCLAGAQDAAGVSLSLRRWDGIELAS